VHCALVREYSSCSSPAITIQNGHTLLTMSVEIVKQSFLQTDRSLEFSFQLVMPFAGTLDMSAFGLLIPTHVVLFLFRRRPLAATKEQPRPSRGANVRYRAVLPYSPENECRPYAWNYCTDLTRTCKFGCSIFSPPAHQLCTVWAHCTELQMMWPNFGFCFCLCTQPKEVTVPAILLKFSGFQAWTRSRQLVNFLSETAFR